MKSLVQSIVVMGMLAWSHNLPGLLTKITYYVLWKTREMS
jgi:hypothetical protein